MNLDEDVESEYSNDSDNIDLKIDVEEVDDDETLKKRCRYDVNDKITGINEMEEEIERQLDAKAAKTNLTATNVKNILKHVIMNEDVISMVHNKVHDSDEQIIYEPKLTRSKAKELACSMTDIPWITPIKKPVSPHVQVLVDNDLLHEDSSDDEYDPNNDRHEPSEDEIENVESSDIESEPLTPVTITNTPQSIDTNIINENHYNFNDHEFKIPETPHVLTKEESIGQRTRSKLCLSETPIEQLEQELIPPDILPDMYHNGHLVNDPNWGELFDPNALIVDDDDVNDPSYNILEDNETETVDKEELRSDKSVKVSKKEKDLLYEEFSIDFNELSNNNSLPKLDNDQTRKKKSNDGINLIESNLNNSSNEIEYDSSHILEEPTMRCYVTQEQFNIITCQLEQHVQLMTQHFVMSYMHPMSEIHVQSTKCKNNLNNLLQLKHSKHSLFNISNLSDSMKLIQDWEKKLDDKEFCQNYIKQLKVDMEHGINQSKRRHKYVAKLNSQLLELLMESKALIYPELLPHIPFRAETLLQTNLSYCKSEEYLLAIGMEKYLSYVESLERRFRIKKHIMYDTMCYISKDLIPSKPPDKLVTWVNTLRRPGIPYNPIKFFFDNGYAPAIVHKTTLKYNNHSPSNFEVSLLPKTWQDWIKHEAKKKNLLISPSDNCVKKKLHKILPSQNADSLEINLNDFIKIKKSKNLKNPCVLSKKNNKEKNDELLSLKQDEIINKTEEYMMLWNKSSGRLEVKSKIQNVIKSLTQLTKKSNNTVENILLVMKPLIDDIVDDSPKTYENIDLSTDYQDNDYGGDNCKCDCHENIKSKHDTYKHCKLCDDEYLNKKINSELLKESTPVKIVSERDEKNDTHASTEITQSLPIISSRRQQESSDETTQEQNSLKISLIKNNNNNDINEPNEQSETKIDSLPDTTAEKKQLTLSDNNNSLINSTNETSPTKSEKEEYNKTRESKTELNNISPGLEKINDDSLSMSDDSDDTTSESSDINTETDLESEQSFEDDNFNCNQEQQNKSWTRQEDLLLLKNIQKDYSDDTFARVSKLLGDRTFDEVKKRCDMLLGVLQNMYLN